MRMHVAAAIVLSGAIVAAQLRTPLDVSRLGPQVGEPVPDFTFLNQRGATRSLQSVMGDRGAMLVFIRSADWRPYCKTPLVELLVTARRR